MGRTPCCDKANVKKGPWSPEEDAKLKQHIHKHGTGGNWISLPQKADLKRCGKSCRLRWLNYLRPDIKHGDFSEEEDRIICNLFATIGSRWSVIAAQLAGRTDNDIKNYWNTKLKKKVMGINNNNSQLIPQPSSTNSSSSSSPLSSYSNHSNNNNNNNPSWSISFPPNLLNPTTTNYFSNTPIFHQLSQDQTFIFSPPMRAPVKAGGEASCSSDDGSVVVDYGGGVEPEMINRRSSSISTFVECSSVVNMNNNDNQKQLEDGMWMETPLMDYGLEEIKQLISSSSCSNVFF